jgi:hypothetical protein
MRRVDKRRVGRLGRVVPLTGCGLSAGVLRRGDDLEVARFQFLVDILPTWQIKAAPSPGGPGDQQHLLAFEVGEVNGAAAPVGQRDIGRHARLQEPAAHHLHLAEAPDALVGV